MALIDCPDCGNPVSSRAERCPTCGRSPVLPGLTEWVVGKSLDAAAYGAKSIFKGIKESNTALRGVSQAARYGEKDVSRLEKENATRSSAFQESAAIKSTSLDLYYEVALSKEEFANGCLKEIKVESRSYSVKIPAGIEPGAKLRLKGKGRFTTKYGKIDKQGDLYVVALAEAF